MVQKKPLRRRLGIYARSFKESLGPPSGTKMASKLGSYTRRTFGSGVRLGKRLFRKSKGGIVSFFTDPRGYANHILFVFLMLFIIAFFGPAIYDFSIIAVMGFLGVLKMLLQFLLILFEFPVNTATELLSGMINSLVGVVGWNVGTWHFDINGDGVYTSLYHLTHNVILQVPNVHLSSNFWDYTIVSYLTNWGSSASSASASGIQTFSGHAALTSDHARMLVGHSASEGWMNRAINLDGVIRRIPYA